MANFLSATYQPAQPRTDENFNLLASVQLMKQQTYDANRDKIQQTLTNWGLQEVLRPEDQEYISAKLTDLTNTINTLGNRDLSSSNVTADINNKIALASQDVVIQNAIENTAKYQAFNSQVSKLREKNPEQYSDINYQDALDMAGFNEYMSGATNKIGNLSYNTYVDVPKKINDATSQWAKDHGYRKEFSRENNGYFFVNTERKVLTENEVVNFIQNSIDPETARQMQINARYTFKGVDDASFANQATAVYKDENTQLASEIARLQAGKSNVGKEQASLIDERISDYNERIENNNKKINSGVFNKSTDQYSLYNRDFLKGIARNYVKDEVVDVSYDDTPLDLLKFEADEAYRAETLRLKRLELGLDGSNKVLGTETTGEAVEIDKRRPQDIIADNLTTAKVGLDTVLSRTNRDGYNTKTETEKREYRNSLAQQSEVENINALGYDEELMNAVNVYKISLNDSQSYNQTVVNGVSPLISGAYNDIANSKGGRLQKQNLAATMPTVSRYAQQGISFEDITNPQDKQMIKYELASNFLQYDSGLNDSQREALNVYTKNLERQKVNNTATKQKMLSIKRLNSNSDGIVSSFGQAVANDVTGFLYTATGAIGQLLDPIFKSEAEADRNAKRASQTAENYYNTAEINAARIQNLKRDYFGEQDTNVTEIEGFETLTGRDLRNTFSQGLLGVANTATAMANRKVPENIRDTKAFSYSTENKVQKNIANEIGTVIQAQFPESPIPSATNNNYTIEKTGETYTISYNSGSGQKTTREQVSGIKLQNLPESIRNSFNNKELNWKYSEKNPNAIQKNFTYQLPRSSDERIETIQKFRESYPNSLTDDAYFKILQNPSQTQFATTEEIKTNVIKKYGQNFYNTFQQDIDRIINTDYKTEVRVAPGYGFIATAVAPDLNGRLQNVASKTMPGSYNQAKSLGASMEITLTAIENQIAQLYARNGRN